MDQVLIKEEKYCGQYVALKDYGNPEIIASGKDPGQVYDAAVKDGFLDPVIVFVPDKNMVQIY